MDSTTVFDEEVLVQIEECYAKGCNQELLLLFIPELIAGIRELRENKSLIEQVATEMVDNLSYVEREHNYYVKWFLNCIESFGERGREKI